MKNEIIMGFLRNAHRHSVHGGVDPAVEFAQSGISRDEVSSMAAFLAQSMVRSHVQRVQHGALHRVLGLMDGAGGVD